MKTMLKTLMFVIAMITFPGQVFALKCGHRLVDIGDGKVKVILRCGEPDFRETRERGNLRNCIESGYVNDDGSRQGNQNCHVQIIDVWTYNFGPRKFMKELVFVDGVLENINMLEYGY